jgi:hypothetical protein
VLWQTVPILMEAPSTTLKHSRGVMFSGVLTKPEALYPLKNRVNENEKNLDDV